MKPAISTKHRAISLGAAGMPTDRRHIGPPCVCDTAPRDCRRHPLELGDVIATSDRRIGGQS